jgi:hypothetical protein
VSSPIDRNPTFRLSRFKIGMGASPVEVDPSGSHLAGQIYGFTAPSYLVRKQLVANYQCVYAELAPRHPARFPCSATNRLDTRQALRMRSGYAFPNQTDIANVLGSVKHKPLTRRSSALLDRPCTRWLGLGRSGRRDRLHSDRTAGSLMLPSARPVSPRAAAGNRAGSCSRSGRGARTGCSVWGVVAWIEGGFSSKIRDGVPIPQ